MVIHARMSDLGFGRAPLGSSAFGYGSPSVSNSTSAQVLLDEFGSKRNAMKIDTVTGDFVRNADTGIHLGMDSVQQQVYLALRTLKGSAVIQTLGIAFKITTLSETTEQKVKEAVADALSQLTARSLIRIDNVEAKRVKMTGLSVAVTWSNLTTNEKNISRWTNG